MVACVCLYHQGLEGRIGQEDAWFRASLCYTDCVSKQTKDTQLAHSSNCLRFLFACGPPMCEGTTTTGKYCGLKQVCVALDNAHLYILQAKG